MSPDIEKIRARIAAAYDVWSLPKEATQRDRTTAEQFSRMLELIAPKLPAMPYSIVPSSFDPSKEPLYGYPRRLESGWDSCAALLRAFDCVGVMMRAPLFWQLEQPLFRATRISGSFIFVNDAANMPVGSSAIEIANMDAVVTDPDDARRFAEFLTAGGKKSPRLWLLVHDASRALSDLSQELPQDGAGVGREIHIVPGVAPLVQCASIARERAIHFHASEEYLLDTTGANALVTSMNDEPLPLWKYELPFRLEEKGSCECGKELLEIRPR